MGRRSGRGFAGDFGLQEGGMCVVYEGSVNGILTYYVWVILAASPAYFIDKNWIKIDALRIFS
jgi:hypothetical protein